MTASGAVRILMLSSDAVDDRGCRAPFVRDLAGALARAGDRVTLVVRARGPATLDRISDGVRVVEIPDRPPLVPPWDRVAWALQFGAGVLEAATAEMLASNADVIHAHGWESTWAGVALRRLSGAALVAGIHGPPATRLGVRGAEIVDRVEGWLCREAGRVVVRSRQARSRLCAAHGLVGDRVAIVRKGRDPAARMAPIYAEAALARLEPRAQPRAAVKADLA